MTTAAPDTPSPQAGNRLYYGDCLEVMSGLPSEFADLIYLDPPFNSDADYNILYGAVGVRGGPTAQVRAFQDTWQWDEDAAARVREALRATAHPRARPSPACAICSASPGCWRTSAIWRCASRR